VKSFLVGGGELVCCPREGYAEVGGFGLGALGKRSRDLGTTFTYGMLMGMISPVIGIVFLFQEKKI